VVTGKAARKHAPRSSHEVWDPPDERPDPVDVLAGESATRIPELVPIRYDRMATSPFAFFRGAAAIMAHDLSGTPVTGMRVQLCGDAHLSNFGGFGTPERNLVFDLNDFDETLPGPWEWDVKRLAASVACAARERGIGAARRRAAVAGAVAEYRGAIRSFALMSPLDVWYARIKDEDLAARLRARMTERDVRRFERNVAKARTKDSTRAFTRLAQRVDGDARIVADPPLVVPIEDLVPAARAGEIDAAMHDLIGRYGATLAPDRRRLIERYRYAHVARKVVGVGSVGTRAWIVLLIAEGSGDPLFLQAKEAEASVLEPYAGKTRFDNQGRRVVEGQRLMQAAGDPFLGWIRNEGIDGQMRDFYIRQLWDWKASADVGKLSPDGLAIYARLCGWTLARAHARSGDPAAIGAYLGSGDVFDRAIAAFAEAYADQNERDYGAFMAALAGGRLTGGRARSAA
jgi:uncharacterized protein (DUF2252 family)